MSSWIKVHIALEEHPKIHMLAKKMHWDTTKAIGCVIKIWFWCMKYSESGDLSKFDPQWYLYKIVPADQIEKLYVALKESGFIDSNDKVHNWLEYAGPYFITKYRTHQLKKLNQIFLGIKRFKSQKRDNKKSDQRSDPESE